METVGTGEVIAHEMGYPSQGEKTQSVVDAANAQLDNLADVLSERGIRVRRPDPDHDIDWSIGMTSPLFDVPNQYCATCPRDVVTTLGNVILEASMSRRDRYFEVYAYRKLIQRLWKDDTNVQWKAAPKASYKDEMYDSNWWDLDLETRYERMHQYEYCLKNEEPIFDAADIMRCGQDLFVQLSMTCNQAGIEWLRRELSPLGMRIHTVRFPYV